MTILHCNPFRFRKELSVSVGRKQPAEFPTVYLDLRDSVLNSATDEGPGKPAETSENTEREPRDKSELTGKTLLLRQLRQRKSAPSTDFPNPNIAPTEPASDQQENIDTSFTTQIQKKRRLKSDSMDSPKIHAELEEKIISGDREQEDMSLIRPQPSPANIQEISCAEEPEQKEKQEKEKRSRRRMQTQLEGLKPRNSVNGRQPMAEETPVLFHPEASYGPEVSALPASSNSGAEMVLLTVWLSSCGQIIIPGQHGGRSPDSALSSANAYHVLLTWLLSLVPALTPQNRGVVPFHVLGLQQVWREEGLALYACLAPPDTRAISSPRIRKRKGKEDFRGMSGFYQHVSLFLAQNTLQSVAWWIEGVTYRLQKQHASLHLEVPPVKLSNIVTLNSTTEAVEKAFSSASGFFWQTWETEEKLSPLTLETNTDNETEVLSVTLFDSLLRDPIAFHHALHLILMKGLDVCGLRLLYPEDALLRTVIDTLPPSYTKKDVPTPPVMALALRGRHTGDVWGDISGPCDPKLARLTDRHSLHALYGSSREEPILRSARGSGRLMRDLSLWFGGRISHSGNVNVGIQNPPARSTDTCRPPALLTATIKGDVFLVVSPIVPPCAYGDVIDICVCRGFAVYGVRRVRLSAKRVAMMNMSANQVSIFCPNAPSEQLPSHPILHCLMLLLRKENACHNVPGLIHGLTNGLAEHGVLGTVRKSISRPGELDPSLYFHVVPYSDALLQGLGGSLHAVPDPSNVTLDVFSKQPFISDPELEQVVILTMSGRHTLKRAGHFLRQILRPFPEYQKSSLGSQAHRFELLGLKWLPCLSRLQAKEITPYEVGDRPWQGSVERLTSNPALVCALRRVHAFATMELTIRELAPTTDKRGPQLIMSATPEIAFRQAALIFTDKEMINDPGSRCIMKYVAPPWITYKSGGEAHRRQTESVFTYMLMGESINLIFNRKLRKSFGVSAVNTPENHFKRRRFIYFVLK
ncbi:dynein axonemal assembly factor 8-like [Spea bombifrons]|uniref:dynein axonemal assembly factor 8-like n=1 Tax=Spea bombifrons TaxID=233779 RepID=UPI00234B4002|nr:dynein axonemal assembly factor 8-like [Spea bombifrons]